MNWQQITMIVWIGLSVILQICLDGKPKEGTYHTAPALAELAFIAYVLYSAGFWK